MSDILFAFIGLKLTIEHFILLFGILITGIIAWNQQKKREEEIAQELFHKISLEFIGFATRQREYSKEDIVLWDSMVFNTMEYASYLVNKQQIRYHLVKDFWGPLIIQYFEGVLGLPEYKEEKNNPEEYKEWKSLVEILKKDGVKAKNIQTKKPKGKKVRRRK